MTIPNNFFILYEDKSDFVKGLSISSLCMVKISLKHKNIDYTYQNQANF